MKNGMDENCARMVLHAAGGFSRVSPLPAAAALLYTFKNGTRDTSRGKPGPPDKKDYRPTDEHLTNMSSPDELTSIPNKPGSPQRSSRSPEARKTNCSPLVYPPNKTPYMTWFKTNALQRRDEHEGSGRPNQKSREI